MNPAMSNLDGGLLGQEAHLQQSIYDIIMTPVGSRVMRRDYGSRVFYLLDQPVNGLLVARLQAEIAQALYKFEPRVKFSRVQITSLKAGTIEMNIEGVWRNNNRIIRLSRFQMNRN